MTSQLTDRQQHVLDTFNANHGNIRRTARILGITPTTLRDHLNAIHRRLEPELPQEQRGHPDDNPPGGC